MTPSNSIFIDLTEALLSSTPKRVQYYGIARTVIEIGKHAARLHPSIRFVVFSFGERAFYEVEWRQTADGSVVFDLPNNSAQRWFRTSYGGSALISGVAALINVLVSRRNLKSWKANTQGLSKVTISDGVLFSAGRPKFIVDMIKALEREKSGAAVATLVHDFMPLHRRMTKRFRQFDKNFLYDNRFAIDQSSLVVANSQFTADDLKQFNACGMLPKPKQLAVVPLVQECPEGFETSEISLPSRPYLLTVGLNLGRKNIEVVFEALLRLKQRGKVVPILVVAGAVRKRLRRYIENKKFAPIRDCIFPVSNPNQTDLVRLYSGALALVIPSRMEGWGLPAGEAMWCGAPVVCSTAPVLREVCGDLALYFEPDDFETLADIFQRLVEDDQFRDSLRKGIADAKPKFRTWETVTSELLPYLINLKGGHGQIGNEAS